MIIRSPRGRPRHLTLSLSVPVVVVLVFSFVEERSEEVKNTICNVSRDATYEHAASVNLRADDGGDECSPWQLAVRFARDDLTRWTETSSIFLTTWPTGATIRSSKNGDSDESPNKAKIQEHQRPANQFRLVLQEAAEKHGDEGVKNRSGEDTDDGAIGSCKTASSFSRVSLDNFDEARGEETDGDDRGDELNETQNALEP